jgi:acyl carrier protein
MITQSDIKEMLLERKLFAEIENDIENDDVFHLDSVSIIWLIEGLMSKYDINITLDQETLSQFTSINNIYVLVSSKMDS